MITNHEIPGPEVARPLILTLFTVSTTVFILLSQTAEPHCPPRGCTGVNICSKESGKVSIKRRKHTSPLNFRRLLRFLLVIILILFALNARERENVKSFDTIAIKCATNRFYREFCF